LSFPLFYGFSSLFSNFTTAGVESSPTGFPDGFFPVSVNRVYSPPPAFFFPQSAVNCSPLLPRLSALLLYFKVLPPPRRSFFRLHHLAAAPFLMFSPKCPPGRSSPCCKQGITSLFPFTVPLLRVSTRPHSSIIVPSPAPCPRSFCPFLPPPSGSPAPLAVLAGSEVFFIFSQGQGFFPFFFFSVDFLPSFLLL